MENLTPIPVPRYLVRRVVVTVGILALLLATAGVVLVVAVHVAWYAVFALAAAVVMIDWAIAPSIIEVLIPAEKIPHDGTRYLTDAPLGALVAQRCRDAGLPLVHLGVVDDELPNAFTFGHTRRSARVFVTRGLLERLDTTEVDAVVCHELGHVRNHDMAVMTAASLVPMVLYLTARLLVDLDADSDSDEGGASIFALPILALYLVSEAAVLSLSRTREYGADHFACATTGSRDGLSSALVKIGYGIAVGERARDARESQDTKAASRQERRAHTVRGLGIFSSGHASSMVGAFGNNVDTERVVAAMRWDLTSPWARVLEKFSTHPVVARRIAALERAGFPGRVSALEHASRRDVPTQGALWRAFVAEVAVATAPWVVLFAAFPLAGPLFLLAYRVRYRRPFTTTTVSDLAERVDAGPVRGIPVELHGRIVRGGLPGNLFDAALVLDDGAAMVPLSAARKADELVGDVVIVRGWYRRRGAPVVEVFEVETAGGRTVRSGRLRPVRLGCAIVLTVATVVALGTIAVHSVLT